MLMFQTHCYDSWMSPEAKKSSSLIAWSRLGGTLPAPLFIFLAGVSFALVTEKLREKGIERGAIAKQTILRGAEIFGMGLLFRVKEYALGFPWAPWTDLLRVDVLNILGLDYGGRRRRGGENPHSSCGDFCSRDCGDGDASPLDDAPAELSAVAARVLRQRCARFQGAAGVALSAISMVSICFRGASGGIFLVFGFCEAKGGADVCGPGWCGNRCLLFVGFVRFIGGAAVRDLRLLAQQSGFSADALRHFADDTFSGLRMVPMGICAEGFQPDHPARANFAAGVLGTHRICLWKILHFAKGAVQRAESHRRTDCNFSSDADSLFDTHKLERVAG